MTAAHTPEPWRVERTLLWGKQKKHYIISDTGAICKMFPYTNDNDDANAERIVACVNSCKGINPEAVPLLLQLARDVISCEGGEQLMGGIFLTCQRDLARKALTRAESPE